jgi:hypothetical protein
MEFRGRGSSFRREMVTGSLPLGEIIKAASLSRCGHYRYLLERSWGPGAVLIFVMLNPSVADHNVDDPTLRRCMGFARREGMDGILIANLFALRSPDPVELLRASDPIGPGNARALRKIAVKAAAERTPIACAWGANVSLASGERAATCLSSQGAQLVCLGKTRNGSPRHPLYVRGEQPFEPYP